MFKVHVRDLQKGDPLYVEDSLGGFYLTKVGWKFHSTLFISNREQYSIKTGIQRASSRATKAFVSNQPGLNRIHFGDGLLFTPELVGRRQQRQNLLADRRELIYAIKRALPYQFDTLSNQELIELARRLHIQQILLKELIYEPPKPISSPASNQNDAGRGAAAD